MAERLWIVRHGETEWSANGRHTSHTDLPLTPAGREQARRAADALAGVPFARVLSSPLRRARDTCELTGFGQAMEVDDDLHEWDYGDYEGLTSPQIREQRPDWWLWRDGCPGGESPSEIRGRIDGLLGRIAETEGEVLAFAHGHVLRVLGARWIEMEVGAGARLKLATAGLGVLGYEHEIPVIERWSV